MRQVLSIPMNRIYEKCPSFLAKNKLAQKSVDKVRDLRNRFVHQVLTNPSLAEEVHDFLLCVIEQFKCLLNEIDAIDKDAGYLARSYYEACFDHIMCQGFDPAESELLDKKSAQLFASEYYSEFLAGIWYYARTGSSEISKPWTECALLATDIPCSTSKGFFEFLKRQLNEEGDVDVMYSKFFAELGKNQMLKAAEEAVKKFNTGLTTKTVSREFIDICNGLTERMLAAQKQSVEDLELCKYSDWTPRAYQEELAEAAWEMKNSIIKTPIGTGRTKVISLVMQKLWDRKRDGKIVVVNSTLAYVLQTARSLKASCRAEHKRFATICTFDSIAQKMNWSDVLSKYDCLVVTAASLIQIWKEDFGKDCEQCFAGTDLMVFDECHHTDGEHPYKQIVDTLYKERQLGRAVHAYVLGVIVNIGESTCIGASHNQIAELLKRLGCELINLSSTRQMEQLKFSYSVSVKTVRISQNPLELWISKCLEGLRVGVLSEGHRLEAALTIQENDNEVSVYRALQAALQSSLHMVNSVGTRWSLSQLANAFINIMIKAPTSRVLQFFQSQAIFFRLFSPLEKSGVTVKGFEDDAGYIKDFASTAQCRFISELENSIRECSEPGKSGFHGIVFFKSVEGAERMLSILLGNTVLSLDREFEFRVCSVRPAVRPQKYLGSGGIDHDLLIENMKRFSGGECNLLLSTLGDNGRLEFPRSNFVVCVDGIDSDISLVRCLARIRDKSGKLLLFVISNSSTETHLALPNSSRMTEQNEKNETAIVDERSAVSMAQSQPASIISGSVLQNRRDESSSSREEASLAGILSLATSQNHTSLSKSNFNDTSQIFANHIQVHPVILAEAHSNTLATDIHPAAALKPQAFGSGAQPPALSPASSPSRECRVLSPAISNGQQLPSSNSCRAPSPTDWISRLKTWLDAQGTKEVLTGSNFTQLQVGPSHMPTITCKLSVQGRIFEHTGHPGQSFKELKQIAAQHAYTTLVAGATRVSSQVSRGMIHEEEPVSFLQMHHLPTAVELTTTEIQQSLGPLGLQATGEIGLGSQAQLPVQQSDLSPATPNSQNLAESSRVQSPIDWISKLKSWLDLQGTEEVLTSSNFSRSMVGPSHMPTITCKLSICRRYFDHTGNPGQSFKELKQITAQKAFQELVVDTAAKQQAGVIVGSAEGLPLEASSAEHLAGSRGEMQVAACIQQSPPRSQSPAIYGYNQDVTVSPSTPNSQNQPASEFCCSPKDWVSELKMWLDGQETKEILTSSNFTKSKVGPSHLPTITCRLSVCRRDFEHTGHPGQSFKELKQIVCQKAFNSLAVDAASVNVSRFQVEGFVE